jgi:hypothetical protein
LIGSVASAWYFLFSRCDSITLAKKRYSVYVLTATICDVSVTCYRILQLLNSAINANFWQDQMTSVFVTQMQVSAIMHFCVFRNEYPVFSFDFSAYSD